MYNVFIGMPSGGSVKSPTVTSIIGAMDMLKREGVDAGLSIITGGYVAHNRNNLVREARERKATHLMFIDADHTFAPSAILRLLHHDKDIVAANYNTRGNMSPDGELLNVIKPLNEKGEMITDGSIARFEMPRTLFPVGGIGTGFMLIKMSVFDKLDSPWFVAWEDKDGKHHTEDIDFCMNARKKGFTIWCSPSVKIGHIGTQTF